MAEALKNLYTRVMIESLATELESEYTRFDGDAFVSSVFDRQWKQRELKQRLRHITETLHDCLPDDYATSLEILKSVAPRFSGFQYMFFPDYVELYGLDDFRTSIPALEHFTPYSSSEFAVRPFIVRYSSRMMKQMETWAASNDPHVRRLASEGCRPRLPWAMALPGFKKNPEAVIRVLQRLGNDESEYVRRSVANNLNDISKDNPAVTLDIARQWLGENPETDRMIRHACRTLLKKGDRAALRLFGFNKPSHVELVKLDVTRTVAVGAELDFAFRLRSSRRRLGRLRVEYALDFAAAGSRRRTKVFSIAERDFAEPEQAFIKRHSFRPITTRRYYPGQHRLSILVNGLELGCSAFKLTD